VLTYGLGAVAALVCAFSDDLEFGFTPRQRFLVVLGIGAGAFIVLAAGGIHFASARVRFEQRLAAVAADQALEQLSDAMQLPELLRINRKQMRAYDALARGQASSSYRIAQIAITVGLAVLVGGSIVAIAAQNQTTKITTAALAAIGGAIGGYIGRTFLRTYERALQQLNFYFEQPQITSYILTVERLTEHVATERRDDVYTKTIDQIMATLVRPREDKDVPSRRG
jgi:hypothetical protein